MGWASRRRTFLGQWSNLMAIMSQSWLCMPLVTCVDCSFLLPISDRDYGKVLTVDQWCAGTVAGTVTWPAVIF